MRLDRFQSVEEWFGDEEQSTSDEEWSSNEERPSDAPLSLGPNEVSHLELSIHEICHYRVGPTLWTYCRDSDKPDLDGSNPLRSLADILGIKFDNDCIRQMQLLAMDFDYARYRQLLKFWSMRLSHFTCMAGQWPRVCHKSAGNASLLRV